MAAQTSFGRRRPARPIAVRATPSEPALNPAAEAFRAELASGRREQRSDFDHWLRGRHGRRLLAWFVGLALLSPGAVCFLLQTPPLVWAGLEVAGVAANWWLRGERRRHLKEITTWQSPAAAE